MKKMGLKCLKNGKNHDAIIALSYPLFLVMIHREETQLRSNLKEGTKVQ